MGGNLHNYFKVDLILDKETILVRILIMWYFHKSPSKNIPLILKIFLIFEIVR